MKWAENLKSEFTSTEAVEQFVNLNSDVSFNGKYMSQAELPASIASLYSAPQGTVIGPYEEGGSVKMARLVKSANVPDSVEARHILIRPSAKLTAEAAKTSIDSIYNAIKKGASFADLAAKYSEDGSAAKGGNLGWFKEGDMVKEFNDVCFFGKKGDMEVVQTQFGYHVVEVLNQAKASMKVQVAILEKGYYPKFKKQLTRLTLRPVNSAALTAMLNHSVKMQMPKG
jgi:peptidyl-prolyl cis-trans isomerase D